MNGVPSDRAQFETSAALTARLPAEDLRKAMAGPEVETRARFVVLGVAHYCQEDPCNAPLIKLAASFECLDDAFRMASALQRRPNPASRPVVQWHVAEIGKTIPVPGPDESGERGKLQEHLEYVCERHEAFRKYEAKRCELQRNCIEAQRAEIKTPGAGDAVAPTGFPKAVWQKLAPSGDLYFREFCSTIDARDLRYLLGRDEASTTEGTSKKEALSKEEKQAETELVESKDDDGDLTLEEEKKKEDPGDEDHDEEDSKDEDDDAVQANALPVRAYLVQFIADPSPLATAMATVRRSQFKRAEDEVRTDAAVSYGQARAFVAAKAFEQCPDELEGTVGPFGDGRIRPLLRVLAALAETGTDSLREVRKRVSKVVGDLPTAVAMPAEHFASDLSVQKQSWQATRIGGSDRKQLPLTAFDGMKPSQAQRKMLEEQKEVEAVAPAGKNAEQNHLDRERVRVLAFRILCMEMMEAAYERSAILNPWQELRCPSAEAAVAAGWVGGKPDPTWQPQEAAEAASLMTT